MTKKSVALKRRELKTECLKADLAVVGGGLAGVCCAITAARAGVKSCDPPGRWTGGPGWAILPP